MVDLFQLLDEAFGNPLIYFLLVFVYSILVAIVLPFPIEFALLEPFRRGSLVLFTATLLAVALGKAVGAWLVFLLGVRVESAMHRWASGPSWTALFLRWIRQFGWNLVPEPGSPAGERMNAPSLAARRGLRELGFLRHIERWAAAPSWIARVIRGLEKFVRVTGSLGLYILLSTPLMSDTVPIYFYAIFNREGRSIGARQFILSNFLAGVNRVAIVFILLIAFGIQLIQ